MKNNVEENTIIDIIIEFVKALKGSGEKNGRKKDFYMDDGTNRLWNAKYLLNQILRSYNVPEYRKLISKKAKETWEEITKNKDEIKNYYYTKKFKVLTDEEIIIEKYVGASNSSKREAGVLKGKEYQYHQVFHDEHVIPVSTIIDNLESLSVEDLTRENVKKVLDKIYICRMLKKESRDLDAKYKTKRENTVIDTIDKIFINECKIEIDNWEEEKNKLLKENQG